MPGSNRQLCNWLMRPAHANTVAPLPPVFQGSLANQLPVVAVVLHGSLWQVVVLCIGRLVLTCITPGFIVAGCCSVHRASCSDMHHPRWYSANVKLIRQFVVSTIIMSHLNFFQEFTCSLTRSGFEAVKPALRLSMRLLRRCRFLGLCD